MAFQIRKAVRKQQKGRIGLVGPAGSGKTYSALVLAQELAGPNGQIVLLDSENSSSEKYADLFDFLLVPLDDDSIMEPFAPERYVEAIEFAESQLKEGDVIVIDSLSHAWAGKGGALEQVDKARAKSRSGNGFAAWRDVTPKHNDLIEAMLGSKCHIIACMRAKTEYVQEKDEHTGKTTIRKVGMAPVQREGMDYEFDIVFDLDWENRAVISKTRYHKLRGGVWTPLPPKVAQDIAAWLDGGSTEPDEVLASAPEKAEEPEPDVPAVKSKTSFLQWVKWHDLDNADPESRSHQRRD